MENNTSGYIQVRTLSQQPAAMTAVVRSSSSGKLFVTKTVTLPKRAQQDVRRETELHDSLAHPNILSTHKRFIQDSEGSYVVVSHYCSQGSLNQTIGDRTVDIKCVMLGIARGIHYLHYEKGIAHLNLKPENIFVSDEQPLIGDLGLFRLLISKDRTSHTQWYWPPEGLLWGFSADIWALGLIFLELSIGIRLCELLPTEPPPCKQPEQSLKRLLDQLNDAELRVLISSMLQKNTAQRAAIEQVIALLEKRVTLVNDNMPPSHHLTVKRKQLISNLYGATEESWYCVFPKDQIEAECVNYVEQIKAEASNSNTKAMYLLAKMSINGTGVPKDSAEGLYLLLQCAAQSEQFCFFELFLLQNDSHMRGIYLRRGVQFSNVRCICTLAKRLFYGLDGEEKNEIEARKLLELAATQEYPEAWYWLGRFESKQPFEKMHPNSAGEPFFKRGAELNDKASTEAMGVLMHLQSNHAAAMRYYLKAYSMPGDSHYSKGMFEGMIALCYHQTDDRLNAKKWLELGASFGDKQCLEWLTSFGYASVA